MEFKLLESLILISPWLKPDDYFALMCVNKNFQITLQKFEEFWQQAYLKDFNKFSSLKPTDISWEKFYRKRAFPQLWKISNPNLYSINGTPLKINLPRIIQIATGKNHVLALDRLGKVWGFGSNLEKQLGSATFGSATFSSIEIPVIIPNLSPIIKIAACESTSLFLSEDNQVWACGLNDRGQCASIRNLQDSSSRYIIQPTKSPFFECLKIIDFSIGPSMVLFLDEDGEVYTNREYIRGHYTIYKILLKSSIREINCQVDCGVLLTNNGRILIYGYHHGVEDIFQRPVVPKIIRVPIRTISNQKIVKAVVNKSDLFLLDDAGRMWKKSVFLLDKKVCKFIYLTGYPEMYDIFPEEDFVLGFSQNGKIFKILGATSTSYPFSLLDKINSSESVLKIVKNEQFIIYLAES